MEPEERKKTHLWGKGVLAQLRKCDGVERYTRSSSETIEPVSANSSMCNTMEPVEKRKSHLWGKGVLAQLRKCDGVERYTQSSSEMIKNRMGRVIARKRMGAEYHPRNRTANRVISKDNGKPSYIDSRYSEDTYPTDAITDSSASEEEYDGYTSEWTTRTNASEWTTKTTETEKKPYVSWLDNSNDQTSKNNGKQTDHVSPSPHKDVPSPTSSVGAVKISAKDRFDYIRSKNRLHFAINPAQKDPPSDKTMMTSRSIRAADAGSILFKSVHRRKNELATQIIKRRQKTPAFSQFGYEP